MLTVWSWALCIFIIDTIIKTYIRYFFHVSSFPVINNIFHLTPVFNTGAAFGLFRGMNNFIIYGGIVFLMIFVFLFKEDIRYNKSGRIALGLILGGALSNISDRIFLGYVVDYIDLRIWPVFNLSDLSISIGAFILFINYFCYGKKNRGR